MKRERYSINVIFAKQSCLANITLISRTFLSYEFSNEERKKPLIFGTIVTLIGSFFHKRKKCIHQCDICNARFTDKFTLITHMINAHKGKKNYNYSKHRRKYNIDIFVHIVLSLFYINLTQHKSILCDQLKTISFI